MKLVENQQGNGSWRYHGGNERIRSGEDYDQIETYRILRVLVEEYAMSKRHPSLARAAEYLFAHQTAEGDFRGICGNQYMPYYSAAMMELLIKAGYGDDPRVSRGFRWLLSMRQDDGGWAFPMRTLGKRLTPEVFRSQPIEPDRSKPFSHLATGNVLRAFAAHPKYRRSPEAKAAADLLASSFFKPDNYPDRQAPSFWTSFSFPFWFTDLISALDSVTLIAPGKNVHVSEGIDWLVSRQRNSGLWNLRLRAMAREETPNHWISLAVCRILKRFFSSVPH